MMELRLTALSAPHLNPAVVGVDELEDGADKAAVGGANQHGGDEEAAGQGQAAGEGGQKEVGHEKGPQRQQIVAVLVGWRRR